jgi:hypothetical protein
MAINPKDITWDEISVQDVTWDEPVATTQKIKPTKAKYSVADIPQAAVMNAPQDVANIASGLANVVSSPVQTMDNLIKLSSGMLSKALPESVMKYADKNKRKEAEQVADTVIQSYKDSYGSKEDIKRTLAERPVSALLDVSTVLGGGGALLKGAGKAGQTGNIITKTGEALSQAGNYTNPITGGIKAIEYGAPKIGSAVANVVDYLGTHTGAEAIKQAAKAGFTGNKETFLKNLRGDVSFTEVVDQAKTNLETIASAKREAYKAGMVNVAKDKTILEFAPIDKSFEDVSKVVKYKDIVKNDAAKAVYDKISGEVNAWKNLNPTEYHTPEGFDALKQRIGSVVEQIPLDEKTAKTVGNTLYNSVKNSIVKQAPSYANVMKDYAEATDLIKEIERSLSLGKQASVDTSLRKLQSIMRNNVNTNYGGRTELAKQLMQQGGTDIMPALAGQALSSAFPRGLAGAGLGAGTALGAGLVGGIPLGLATAAIQSPYLVGQTALRTGQIAKGIKQTLGTNAAQQAYPYLYQLNRTDPQGLLSE